MPSSQDEGDSELELLDDIEAPLQEVQVVLGVAPDGLPDPLATIAEMLPGGRATRGKPPIVYVPTRLDTDLVAALREREPTLVVLSGNAGDGKTAFLAQVIEAAGGTYEPGVRNVYDIEVTTGRRYRVVLDGSEDTADRTNDALLDDALAGFNGDGPVAGATRGTLIAINKGRLLRFLQTRRTSYPYLWDLVRAAFLGDGEVPATPYVLIDLNDRTFIGPDFESSLMTSVLDRLLAWEGWSDCARCPASARCPALANVAFLRDGGDEPGGSTRRRLWRVFAAADLDDRVHITARHVITQLARLISAGRRCPDIRQEHSNGDAFGPGNFVYNALFDPQGSLALGDSSAFDEVLATYDPSERDEALRGRRMHALLAASDLDTILQTPEDEREMYIDEQASVLAELRIDAQPQRGDPDYRQRTLTLTHAIERRLHLHGGSEFAPSFPLDSFDAFLAAAAGASAEQVAPRLISNLNAALGVEVANLPELLSPREYSRGLRGRGFAMLIPPAQFSVAAGNALGVSHVPHDYLETWPRSLLLRAHDTRNGHERIVATLSIPMLMFEILERAGRGFRPASQTERAYIVRLRGFYRRLSEHAWAKRPPYVLYDSGRIVGKAKIDGRDFSLMRL
jgi:hypothetical protein